MVNRIACSRRLQRIRPSCWRSMWPILPIGNRCVTAGGPIPHRTTACFPLSITLSCNALQSGHNDRRAAEGQIEGLLRAEQPSGGGEGPPTVLHGPQRVGSKSLFERKKVQDPHAISCEFFIHGRWSHFQAVMDQLRRVVHRRTHKTASSTCSPSTCVPARQGLNLLR